MERLLSQKPVEMERANSQREGAEKSLSNSKSIERAVSQKAMQLSASVHCKAAAAGFFCGACMTYLCFAAAWMPFRMSAFNGAMPFHRSPGPEIQASGRTTAGNALSIGANLGRMYRLNSSNARLEDVSSAGKGRGRKDDGRPKFRKQKLDDERISLLLSAWEAYFLGSRNQNVGVDWSNVPKAPHIENCKARVEASDQLDNRGSNGSRPPWTAWKGYLGLKVGKSIVHSDMGEELLLEHETVPDGPYPPWIEGGDEDNLPMTRRVQHDLWLHQHPHNCRDPKVRFLLTDWERHSGFGIGAQIAAMAGMLALAINQKRILVTNYFNRADHEGCVGSAHSHWSCYFFLETSADCRQHALDLASKEEAWKLARITSKENYTTKEIWVGKIPRLWGKPWVKIQPTTEIDGKLLMHHRTRDRRWWRAQEVIEESKSYVRWNFYYTNVTRQVGNMSMPAYEASLGRETSTNYPLVNFLMAADADFFIGALGSTWCFLIDGMRNTGGKVMAGYLSVNKDRFW